MKPPGKGWLAAPGGLSAEDGLACWRFAVKLGIVISSTEPETVFNALRPGNYATRQGDAVRVFLLGKGVELDQIDDEPFNVRQQADPSFKRAGISWRAAHACNFAARRGRNYARYRR